MYNRDDRRFRELIRQGNTRREALRLLSLERARAAKALKAKRKVRRRGPSKVRDETEQLEWELNEAERIPLRLTQFNRTNGTKITEAQFWEWHEGQGGLCAICERSTLLVIDHCHETGSIRGLLCRRCNGLLGFATDKVWILHKAIEYLGRPKLT